MLGLFIAAIVLLVTLNEIAGAAMTLGVALVMLIWTQCKVMIWEAERRNNAEREEFEAVNRGEKEPNPRFLEHVWNA